MTGDQGRKDRATNFVLVAVLVITIGTLTLAAAAIPTLLDTRAGVDAQRRSDEIAACRSAWSVELVTGPTTRALQALARDDNDAFRDAAAEADPERFEELAVESRLDPEGFLRRCHSEEPGGG